MFVNFCYLFSNCRTKTTICDLLLFLPYISYIALILIHTIFLLYRVRFCLLMSIIIIILINQYTLNNWFSSIKTKESGNNIQIYIEMNNNNNI